MLSPNLYSLIFYLIISLHNASGKKKAVRNPSTAFCPVPNKFQSIAEFQPIAFLRL